MCGRYTIYEEPEVLETRFHATLFDPDTYQPHFNASPSQRLPIIRNDRPNEIVLGFWGFVPSWGYEGTRMSPAINARGETVADSLMFREAFARRRCLVLMNGFYEWERKDGVTTPYYITLQNGAPFACAGIWETPSARTRDAPRFAILTVGANTLISTIHDRMPVILDEHDERAWLDVDSLIAPSMRP